MFGLAQEANPNKDGTILKPGMYSLVISDADTVHVVTSVGNDARPCMSSLLPVVAAMYIVVFVHSTMCIVLCVTPMTYVSLFPYWINLN